MAVKKEDIFASIPVAKKEDVPRGTSSAVNNGGADDIFASVPVAAKNELPSGASGIDSKLLSKKIADIESAGGDYTAINPNSSATGKYQFLWGDFGDAITDVTGAKTKQEFLDSPEKQEKFFDYHVENNLKPAVSRLEGVNKLGYSDSQLAMLVHFKGEKGAKEWLMDGTDKTSKNNASIPSYLGEPEGNVPVPKSMQPATTGVNPQTVHKELATATKFWQNTFFPGGDVSAAFGGDNKPMLPLKDDPAATQQANLDQVKQATRNEVDASKNYLKKYYLNNPDLQSNLSFLGTVPKGDPADPNSGISRLVDPQSDPSTLAAFASASKASIDSRMTRDIAVLDKTYPLVTNPASMRNDFAEPLIRQNASQYNAEVQKIKEKYAQQSNDVEGAIKTVAQLKVANQFLAKKGVGVKINPVDAQEVGWQYMEAIGEGDIAKKQREAAATGKLDPITKVETQRIGYRALQYKMMDAAANDQTVVANHLAKNVANYQSAIRAANPDFVKTQVADAISDDINKNEYKNSVWTHVIGVEPDEEMINASAKRLGLPLEDIKGIKPEDIKAHRGGMIGEWAKGLAGTSAAPIYEFTMRHLIPGVNDEAVNERFDKDWYDNSSFGKFMSQSLPSDNLKEGGQIVETDKNSSEYLMNVANPDAGKWNFDLSNIVGVTLNGLGALGGYAEGIGAASSVVGDASIATKTFGAANALRGGGAALDLAKIEQQSQKVGTAVYTYIANIDNNKKEAMAAMGNDPAKEEQATFLANLYTLGDIAGMELINPAKLRTQILGKEIFSNKDFIAKLSKDGFKSIGKTDIVNAGKEVLKDFAGMQGGIEATEVAHTIADMMLAPEKFKNEDTMDNFIQSSVNAAIVNVLPSLFGGYSHAYHEGQVAKGAVYDVGSNPKNYLDAIDAQVQSGKLQPDAAAQQKGVVNTLADIVAKSVPDVSPATGAQLSLADKQEYAANLYNASVIEAKKIAVKDPVQAKHIDAYLKQLEERRNEILTNKKPEKKEPNAVSEVVDDVVEPAPVASVQNGPIDIPTPTFKVSGELGTTDMHPWTVSVGNEINDALGGEVTFNSAKRSETHNAEVGGKGNSYHLSGEALDIQPADWKKLGIEKQNELLAKYKARAIDEGNHIHLQPVSRDVPVKFAEGFKEKAAPAPVVPENEPNISVSEVMDRPVTYKGEKGTISQDGQEVIFTADKPNAEGRTVEYALGNVDEIGDHPLKDYGIEQHESIVKVNDAGNVEIRGKEYINNHSDPLAAISQDKDGNYVVNLETPEGAKRNFRGQVAEDAAYHIKMQEVAKKHAPAEFEHFINEDHESRTAIEEGRAAAAEPVGEPEQKQADNGRREEVVPQGATENIEQVSGNAEQAAQPVGEPTTKSTRGKIERKQVTPDLFSDAHVAEVGKVQVHPDYDFEDEPRFVKEKPAVSEVPKPAEKKPVLDEAEQKARAENFFNAPQSEDGKAESAKVGDKIKEKFAKAEKIVGNPNVATLHDGSQLEGHYVLTDAHALTPSHDPQKGYKTSEGFPLDEQGRNPNDRDYTQSDVSHKVEVRGGNYDGRAVENIPTVDKNGVVIDGNDRTMSGQIAGPLKTDVAYMDALKKNAQKFGFSVDQIEAMQKKGKNPRVVFVPNDVLPYKTETFAKFNPETQGKAKNRIEKAVTLARTVSDAFVQKLGNMMGDFETSAKFFNSSTAMKDMRNLLMREGILNNDNVNKYFDGPGEINNNGREFVQDLMLGKVLGENELRLLRKHADIREKMLYGMNNIVGIEAMGEKYSLKDQFNEAFHLWDTVERFKEDNGIATMEEALDLYNKSGNLFGEGFSLESQILFDYLDSPKKTNLRDFTRDYLEAAKKESQGIDIFGEPALEREQILSRIQESKNQADELIKKQQESIAANKDNVVDNEQRAVVENGQELPPVDTSQERSGETGNEGDGNKPADTQPDPVEAVAQNETPAPPVEEPTPIPEKTPDDAYTSAVNDFNKYKDFVAKKEAKISELEDRLDDMRSEAGSDAYKKLKQQISTEKSFKKQYELKQRQAQLEIANAQGKRLSDKILAKKAGIAANMAMSSPIGMLPHVFRSLIDLAAASIRLGEHTHDAILDAVIKYREKNPDLKFDENELISALENEINKIKPERNADHQPVIESLKNREKADAIIGRIKSDLVGHSREVELNKIKENPNILPATKDALIEYIEYHLDNEAKLSADPDRFLENFKMKRAEEIKQMVSGTTIEDVFGEKPRGDQDYEVVTHSEMLQDGEDMINLAKQHYGDDVMQWGPKLLESVKALAIDETPKKAVLLATLLGKLREERKNNPEKAGQIRKILDNAESYWQKFIRRSSLELHAAQLLRVFRDKNLSDIYESRILTEKERSTKKHIEKELVEGKITDQAAAEGPLRNESEAMAEIQKENEALKKENEELKNRKPVKESEKERIRKEYATKAKEALGENPAVKDMIESIKEKLKKIKC